LASMVLKNSSNEAKDVPCPHRPRLARCMDES
jgi:hypothetical protein